MINAIKTRIRLLLELLPYGRDLTLLLFRFRESISYRGYFISRESAEAALMGKRSSQYDVVNKEKAENIDQEERKLDSYFKDADYPVFFWLSRVLVPGSRVHELGGSLGHCYYTCQRFGMLPDRIRWTVAELPEAVALGRQLAGKRKEAALDFITSDQIDKAPPADIFLSAGTLQYVASDLWDIVDELAVKPLHIIIHHLPVHDSLNFWTLQRLSLCELPYRVYSRNSVLEKLAERGYSMVTEWQHPRVIEIPFYRNKTSIRGYMGFHFTRVNNSPDSV